MKSNKPFSRAAAVRVARAATPQDLRRAFAIRMRVFVREQGVPPEIELDRDDERALHLVAIAGSKIVGTARVVQHGRSAKIGRMAVLKTYRRRGIGAKLLARAVAAARRRGAQRIYLHAQVTVIGFYLKMGFRAAGPMFDEPGIRHRKMVLPA